MFKTRTITHYSRIQEFGGSQSSQNQAPMNVKGSVMQKHVAMWMDYGRTQQAPLCYITLNNNSKIFEELPFDRYPKVSFVG